MKKITRITGLKGTLTVPGDKSISHRAIMFGSLAEGTTTIHGFLKGADCLSTIDCFRKMGISIEEKVDKMMNESNIKLEIKEDGKWLAVPIDYFNNNKEEKGDEIL